MNVLFVDDEPSILRAYERQFRKRFQVTTMERPEDGLVAVRRECFGIIVSDMRMPGMDGREFLTQAHEISPNSSKILLSGNPMITDVPCSGYFRCLEKPCSREALSAALEEAWNAYLSSIEKHCSPAATL
jgi:DNA-binding NtrC family response regulator